MNTPMIVKILMRLDATSIACGLRFKRPKLDKFFKVVLIDHEPFELFIWKHLKIDQIHLHSWIETSY